MSIKDHHPVIVTLDIGDTTSGYAYAVRSETEEAGWVVHKNAPWNWEKDTTNKNCSTILISKGGQETFGYDAEVSYKEVYLDGDHKGYSLFRHIKREFYKDDAGLYAKIHDQIERKEMDLFSVMAKLFNFFKGRAEKTILSRFPDVQKENFFWVLTVPAAWKDSTKQLYRDLAIEQGISHRNLKVVTEPEACLAYVMTYLNKQENANERVEVSRVISLFDARVLVLDLSGDATTISVHRVSGDKTFKMVFQSRSHRKGSNQVNVSFLLFLSNILGEEIIRTLKNEYEDDYMSMCDEFEMKKRKINPDTPDSDWFTFKFPNQIDETFQEKYGKEYRTIFQRISDKSDFVGKVLYDDNKMQVQISVLKQIFTPVLDNIEQYVRNVLEMSVCARIVSFFLVGGFSQSKIVQEEIKRRFPEMKVVVPRNPELAIMEGAIWKAVVPETQPPYPEFGQYQKVVEETNVISQICSVS